jgi:hypothetical protein
MPVASLSQNCFIFTAIVSMAATKGFISIFKNMESNSYFYVHIYILWDSINMFNKW